MRRLSCFAGFPSAIAAFPLVVGTLAALVAAAPEPALAAAKLAVLIGGSGESATESFLIHDLRDLARGLRARGWEIRASAGPKPGLVTNGSTKGTNTDLLRAVHDYAAHASSGDELLVVVHSHGRASERDWGQRTHSIVSEDADPSGTEPGFDLDPLGPILDAAAARGAHVALVDLSCYSGTTQVLLKSPASCTVTLAAPDYVSLCSGRPEERHFTAHFLDLPRPGRRVSLEEQFLAARREDLDSINLPEISSRTTPAGKAWNEMLTTVDPLDIFEDLKNFRSGPKPFHAEQIVAELRGLPVAAEGEKLRIEILLTDLKQKLTPLLASRAHLEGAVSAMAKSYDEATLELKLPDHEPFKISPGNLADLLEHVGDPKDLDGYTDAQRNLIATLTPLRGSPTLLVHAKPLGDFRERKARFDADAEALSNQAGKAMDLERQLYDALGKPVADPSRAAACQRFQL